VSRAAVEADGTRIRADKSFVTSAAHADVFVVSTLTADGGPTDVDLYAIASDAPGLKVAGPWQGMGLRGNESSPMAVDTVVSDAHRIGGAGAGFGIMMGTVLPWFNLGNAAVSLGLASGAARGAIRHASGARFEQLDQALADLPTIRQRLARLTVQLNVQQAYLASVAASLAAPDDSTTLHVLSVKAAGNDAVLTITDEAMRVCGGAAFSAHVGVDRYFRDARAGHVMAPTADVLYDFIGKAVTGRPLF
jgi:alkylation response protein AidB-like acyl-CoA dehydrogenase